MLVPCSVTTPRGLGALWKLQFSIAQTGVLYLKALRVRVCTASQSLIFLWCYFVYLFFARHWMVMLWWMVGSPIMLPLQFLVLVSNSFASRNCWATMFLFTTSPSFFLTWWINISRYRWIWNNLRATQNASKFFTGMSRVINTRIPSSLANSMVLFPDSRWPLLFAGGDTRCWWLGVEQESKLCVLCWVGLVASCNLA